MSTKFYCRQHHHEMIKKICLNFTVVAMSSNEITYQQELVLPDYGRLFYEQKSDFVFCKPHLMPLKSNTLEKLERMQKQAIATLKETRATTAAAALQK